MNLAWAGGQVVGGAAGRRAGRPHRRTRCPTRLLGVLALVTPCSRAARARVAWSASAAAGPGRGAAGAVELQRDAVLVRLAGVDRVAGAAAVGLPGGASGTGTCRGSARRARRRAGLPPDSHSAIRLSARGRPDRPPPESVGARALAARPDHAARAEGPQAAARGGSAGRRCRRPRGPCASGSASRRGGSAGRRRRRRCRRSLRCTAFTARAAVALADGHDRCWRRRRRRRGCRPATRWCRRPR